MKMRLNKFLAQSGLGSRRKCDALIQSGAIMVNGQLITTPGVTVDPETDQIQYHGEPLDVIHRNMYIMLNKPAGYLSTVHDNFGRRTVIDLVDIKQRIFPVGRLDLNSEGLLLLTDDGEFCYRLTHPKFQIDKVYRVFLSTPFDEKDRVIMEQGLKLDSGLTAPCTVTYVGKGEARQRLCDVVIHEGKKRQVRTMFQSLGYDVTRLIRLKFGSLELNDLKQGHWRYLTNNEVNELKQLTQALDIV